MTHVAKGYQPQQLLHATPTFIADVFPPPMRFLLHGSGEEAVDTC
jgi:hypothetical protein